MSIPYDTRLPPDLRCLKEEIEGYARDYGLDFYETIFAVIDAADLNEGAAYGGLTTRHPHWQFRISSSILTVLTSMLTLQGPAAPGLVAIRYQPRYQSAMATVS